MSHSSPILLKFADFKGLHLFFLSNFSEAMLIQGATSTMDSRVIMNKVMGFISLCSAKS